MHIHLVIQNVSDQLLVASQAAYLSSVGLNKVLLVQVQVWSTVHDVSDDSGQCEPLLGPCCMLVGLEVTVQELENEEEPKANKPLDCKGLKGILEIPYIYWEETDHTKPTKRR